MKSSPARFARVAFWVAACLVAGCEDPAAPREETPAPTPFYPLSLGDAWTYDRARTTQFLDPNGGGEIRPPIELQATAERELISTEDLAGATYTVERQFFFGDGTDTVMTWRRYRQDDSGLYRAAVSTTIPPGSVPPLDSLIELAILQYPLAVAAQWSVSPGSAAMRRVEGVDTLVVLGGKKIGVRIRVTAPTDGPDDVHLEWYGTDGLLRASDHLELFAIEIGTGELIHIVSNESTELIGRHR